MKIVFLSDAIYPYNKGGKEKRLFEISTSLAKLGHDVHIYTMHWWQSAEKTRHENGITLHAISKYHKLYKGSKRSTKEGVLFGLASFRLISVKFDVLDVDHMPFFPIISAWIVCKLKRKKLFGTWHEALSTADWKDYMGLAGAIASTIERLAIKLPDFITAASSRTKQLLDTYHHRTKNVYLVASGVDTKAISKIQPSNENCDVLYVGRLVKNKNIDVLIKAFAKVAQKDKKVACVVIGEGPESHKLQKLISELKLQDRVTLLKPLDSSNDVYAYMKKARAFILPSVREGFGIVVLESLACGTPVVTTNVDANAARLLIANGITGSVVPLQTELFANAMHYWLTKSMNHAAIKLAASYDWEHVANAQLQVYKENI